MGDGTANNYLILIVCSKCGEEHYFDLLSLPGGAEHCEYCEYCFAKLPIDTPIIADSPITLQSIRCQLSPDTRHNN